MLPFFGLLPIKGNIGVYCNVILFERKQISVSYMEIVRIMSIYYHHSYVSLRFYEGAFDLHMACLSWGELLSLFSSSCTRVFSSYMVNIQMYNAN